MAKTAGGKTVVFHFFQLIKLNLSPPGHCLGSAFVSLGGIVDKELRRMNIPGAIEQQALRLGAVPARTARLLIVCLHIFRHIIVYHITDILLVNAHAKGIGGHHDPNLVKQKCSLAFSALFFFQPRMIPGRRNAAISEQLRDLFHVFTGGAVDNPAFIPVLGNELQQRRFFIRGL